MKTSVKLFFEVVLDFIRRFLIGILATGPIPSHIAFIMDGNRRYEKNHNLSKGMGHRAGLASLKKMLQYSYGIGVKYVTLYGFSIDNFKRPAEEVKRLMELFQEKIESLTLPESIVHQVGLRIYFIGNLNLLNSSLRIAAENAMRDTAHYNQAVLLVCISYTSTNEIFQAVQESCSYAANGLIEQEKEIIELGDIEKRMYMAVAPEPDIIIRSSGETRLSNFLLWQTGKSLLYTTAALWPEVGLGHLVWAVLAYQRNYSYLHKKMKQL
ncbi:unnamed protein product [Rhodiola kirilowii]